LKGRGSFPSLFSKKRRRNISDNFSYENGLKALLRLASTGAILFTSFVASETKEITMQSDKLAFHCPQGNSGNKFLNIFTLEGVFSDLLSNANVYEDKP